MHAHAFSDWKHYSFHNPYIDILKGMHTEGIANTSLGQDISMKLKAMQAQHLMTCNIYRCQVI